MPSGSGPASSRTARNAGCCQRSRKLAPAQCQRHRRLTFRIRLHELLSGLHQSLNFGLIERAVVKPDVRQFALKRRRPGNAPQLEIRFRVVELCRAGRRSRHQIAIHVKPGFVHAAAHHGRDMLPGVGADGSRRRRNRRVRLWVASRRFKPQRAPVAECSQIPAEHPVRRAKTDNTLRLDLARVNPGGHREVAFADVRRVVGWDRVARDHERVAAAVQRHRFADRRIDQLRLSLQTPGRNRVHGPGSGQAVVRDARNPAAATSCSGP